MTGAFKAPPLAHEGVVYTAQLDKANVLRRAILERWSATDDIRCPWIYTVVSRWMILLEATVSLEDVTAAIIGVSATTPGIDGLLVKTLRAC